MKVRDTTHVANFHDVCPRQVRNFVVNLSWTLSRTLLPTFPVHYSVLNSIKATQTGLSWTLSWTLSQTSRDGLCSRLS